MSNGTSNPVYNQNPINYALTIGTSSVQILPLNPIRRRLIFHNPNSIALIAISCLVNSNGVALPASLISPGSIVILPLCTFELRKHPVSGWNAISDMGGGLTILEFF